MNVFELVNPTRVLPTEKDRQEMAQALREFADMAERGELRSFALSAVREDARVYLEHFKMPGITLTEILGSVVLQQDRLARQIRGE